MKKHKWHYRAIGSNQFTRSGLPDAYALKNGIVLFIECKSAKGKMSPDQIQEMFDIKNHGGHHIIAYSVDDIKEYCNKNGIELEGL